MPHVEIKCFTGRTEEQKKECAERVSAQKTMQEA
ncbi:tautomerase family protein [Butyrivibrio sp. VCB2006]|nr:tautomerase family protein [Butyrivibrio sp. VCB2006]